MGIDSGFYSMAELPVIDWPVRVRLIDAIEHMTPDYESCVHIMSDVQGRSGGMSEFVLDNPVALSVEFPARHTTWTIHP